jgi:DNA polymerase-1
LDAANHIHTIYSQCTTTTGRFSSSSPNLQNIPSGKSGAGAIVRNYFIPRSGYKLITCDMTGAEITIAADLSKDQLLLRNIEEDMDIHSYLASLSFSIIFGQRVTISKSKDTVTIKGYTVVPDECRDIHKSVTFAKFYRGGPARVYQVLARYINMVHPANKRMPISKLISQKLDAELPKLSRYLNGLIERANKEGYLVTTKLGRRRYFDTKIHGEGANAPIQGSNADAIKIAMINSDKYLKQIGGRIVLTVHDEIVCEVPISMCEGAAIKIQDIMAAALTAVLYELKGKAAVSVADYWKK